ncbi:hypothetical protein DFH08DRAFT_941516 [Mycena albidolilacea]|uniref:Ricin B lectin domain-containing protein n=1 Tax=Mycena albidolilacea TaxID=1033008 RepID=A0AAD6ZIL1_9AGAR|nr:hypothetical protein DFH08DRAFT_941516 [Mycena albidolilacea]
MTKFFGSLLASLTTAAVVSAALTTGHYQIQDFQGRCVSYVATSTNNYVPVVTTPCVNGTQTQIWNVVADSLFAPTYIILTTSGASSTITYASSTASGAGINAQHQQLQLNRQSPPDEDLIISQIDTTHWTLGDTRGGGSWTSWTARLNAQLAAPITLEDVGNSGGPDAQQLFTFVGPL